MSFALVPPIEKRWKKKDEKKRKEIGNQFKALKNEDFSPQRLLEMHQNKLELSSRRKGEIKLVELARAYFIMTNLN